MFKLFSASVLLSIILVFFLLLIPYTTECGFFNLLPCGRLRGLPFAILEEKCIRNCISPYPDDPSVVIGWKLTEDFTALFLFNVIFWFPASLIIIIVINNYIKKKDKTAKKSNTYSKTV